MNKHCSNCRAEVPEGANFCSNCGQSISEKEQLKELFSHQGKPPPRSLQQTSSTPTLDAPPGGDGFRAGLYKVGGGAAMLAGILLVILLAITLTVFAQLWIGLALDQSPINPFVFAFLSGPVLLLLIVALPVLQASQAGRSGRLGRAGFTLAMIGAASFGALFSATLALRFVAPVGSPLYRVLYAAGNTMFSIGFLGGAGLLLLGLALFGIATARADVLPRWAAMMLLGFPLSIAAATLFAYVVGVDADPGSLVAYIFLGGLFSSTVGLIRLGYALWMTAKREEALRNLPRLRSRLWAWANFSGKTGWEWLQILIVPLVLVVIGFLFALQQDARQQAIEEQRTQDITLQAYLDQMGALVLEDLSDSRVRTLARARTLSVLKRLDATRQAEVMQFLVEAELIQSVGEREPVIDLRDADLKEAALSEVDLSNADLSNVDLSYASLALAELSSADLSGADLSYANLATADLSNADLSGADLSYANLNTVDLSNADLRGADLSGADLSYAYLSRADLTNAYGVTGHQLERWADFLEGATMPDGTINAGLYATREFEPALSFSASDGWRLSHLELADDLSIEGPEGGELIFTHPRHVYDPSNPSELKELPAPENADEWASWFQTHPKLDTSKPVPVNVGDASGMRIDVTDSSTPETYPRKICGRQPCVPLYKGSTSESTILSYDGWKDRFIIMDVGGETVIIDVAAPTDKFDEFLPKAQEVLDTVEWKGG